MDSDTLERNDRMANETPGEIERGDTGRRILLTLLFGLIWTVTESALAVIVIFCLIWTLITRQAPPARLRDFSNRLVAYSYRLWRYITYNDRHLPFPFSEFPDALEPSADLGPDDAPELRELTNEEVDEDDDVG